MVVPTDPGELGAEWFARALGADDVEVVALEPTAEQGRASRTYRATLASGYPAVSTSVIVKLSLTDPAYLARRLGLGTYRLEVDFYRLVAPRLGSLVPVCHHAEADDATGHFVLVLEDLAPARAAENIESDLLAAAEGFARIHARCWRDDAVAAVTARCVLPGMLDQRNVGPPERETTRHLLENKLRRHALPEVVVAAARAELDHHERFAAHLRSRSLTCCHGDAHLPQVMFPSNRGGRLSIFDWQTPHYGSGALDLQSLRLTAGLSPARRRALRAPLLDRYHVVLREEGVDGYSRDELEHDHLLMLHHRLMVALVLPHQETPESLALWRTRFLEPLAEELEDEDFAGMVAGL
jgi:hypothetical protein